MTVIVEIHRSGGNGEIEPVTSSSYHLRIEGEGLGSRHFSVTVPWNREVHLRIRDLYDSNLNEIKEFGDELGKWFDPIISAVESALARYPARPIIPLTICTNDAGIFRLPFELMSMSDSTPLGRHPRVSIRYQELGRAKLRLDDDNGHVVLAWANPRLEVPYVEHRVAIGEARCVHLTFDPSHDEIPQTTLDLLVRRLRSPGNDGEPVRALHLLCHGSPVDSAFGLELHKDTNDVDIVDPDRFITQLRPFAATLRLVVVCACNSSNMGVPFNRLESVGLKLHRLGIPYVVASRSTLSCEASVTLSRSLYDLARGGFHQLDVAVAHARSKIHRDDGSPQWSSLQFFVAPTDPREERGLSRALLKVIAAIVSISAILVISRPLGSSCSGSNATTNQPPEQESRTGSTGSAERHKVLDPAPSRNSTSAYLGKTNSATQASVESHILDTHHRDLPAQQLSKDKTYRANSIKIKRKKLKTWKIVEAEIDDEIARRCGSVSGSGTFHIDLRFMPINGTISLNVHQSEMQTRLGRCLMSTLPVYTPKSFAPKEGNRHKTHLYKVR